MLARLGNVLYWVGSIIAGFIVLVAVVSTLGLLLFDVENRVYAPLYLIGYSVAAFIPWLIGYALRYILSGPKTRES